MELKELRSKSYDFIAEVLKSQDIKKDPAMVAAIAELINSVRFN